MHPRLQRAGDGVSPVSEEAKENHSRAADLKCFYSVRDAGFPTLPGTRIAVHTRKMYQYVVIRWLRIDDFRPITGRKSFCIIEICDQCCY